jgi:hypothetical protein
VIDLSQVQIDFQRAEVILYFPDGVVGVPDDKLFLYIHVDAEKINIETFTFFMMFIPVFLPRDFRYQTCFCITVYGNVILVLSGGVFCFSSAYPLVHITLFFTFPLCSAVYIF